MEKLDRSEVNVRIMEFQSVGLHNTNTQHRRRPLCLTLNRFQGVIQVMINWSVDSILTLSLDPLAPILFDSQGTSTYCSGVFQSDFISKVGTEA